MAVPKAGALQGPGVHQHQRAWTYQVIGDAMFVQNGVIILKQTLDMRKCAKNDGKRLRETKVSK